ncbi:MAG: hypothetical protein FJX75_03115 [Armatimonadetes bacterium]|nr:hypothetical protein [Armatimonadota bacterium]
MEPRDSTSSAAVVVLSLLSGFAWASNEPVAAVVTMTCGPVSVLREGRSSEACPPYGLHVGDQVIVGPKGQAVLCFPCGPPQRIVAGEEKSTFEVKPPGSPPENPGPVKRIWRYIVARLRPPGDAARHISPASRPLDTGGPDGLWPRDALVTCAQPDFAWRPSRGGSYQLIILDGKGRRVWQSPPSREPQTTYPLDAPALRRGVEYWWEVADTETGARSTDGPYWFRIADPDRVEAAVAAAAALDRNAEGSDPAALVTAKALLMASRGFGGEAVRLLARQTEPALTKAELESWLPLLAAREVP